MLYIDYNDSSTTKTSKWAWGAWHKCRRVNRTTPYRSVTGPIRLMVVLLPLVLMMLLLAAVLCGLAAPMLATTGVDA